MKFKALISALLCALLGAWYLASSVGFDIHRDHHCDRTYVVSLLNGISCDEIHPEDAAHHCHHHDCCEGGDHDHDGDCEDCSDELEILTITGEDTSGSHIQLSAPVQLLHTAAVCTTGAPLIGFIARTRDHRPGPLISHSRPTDVLRI